MKTNRAKALSTTALIAVLCMQLFWMWNSFEMTVHQMGFETPWNLAPDVRAQALLAAFYESKFTLLTSLLTTVVIILSLIDQINYIDEQERVRLLREDFSYAMVHDMKSPLTSIIMGTKYLHSGVLEKMTVHQMGFETPWNLAPDVRAQALLAAFYESKFTLLTSLLTTVVIILSLIDQINYIDEQERVRLLREDFSYAMVHDMKSPLTSIIMGTKYLHSGVLEKKPEMKEKYFCIVEDEAQHLLALINRLLTISKLEHGKLHIQKAEVNLETMIEDVVDKYKAKSAKPIHIITRFGATSALADEEYLKEAISNLVDNATKYSKEEINIEISTLEDDSNVYIKVFDEGIGIAKSELKTIFNRFERAAEHEKDARKTRGGFGIGLNYVLQVINAHGGKISVKSEKDKWSEFTISLPK